ncbi:TadE/TadG family type IV pilus assembly protein [Luteimicrobium sp. DT211]|uniref:TadE/TadG family type IV pilus assembly protein n=1 Tax=Luteimicrobium sp. DT211 TaxID=3393412 RepID=UPI003CEF4B52
MSRGAPRAGGAPPRGAEDGSAVVDFVLVSVLLVVLFLGVVQVALAQHVRSMLVDSAAEGARYGARADRGPDDAVRRTRELVTADLSSRYARDVTARYTTRDGVDVVEVSVEAPLPVVGLLGPGGVIDVVGHAVREPR